jgi:hypothetical protein
MIKQVFATGGRVEGGRIWKHITFGVGQMQARTTPGGWWHCVLTVTGGCILARMQRCSMSS